MSLHNQESILKEISLALQHRKRLNGQVSKLATDVTTLERTGVVAASAHLTPPLPPNPPIGSSCAQLLQPGFTSPVPPQNGYPLLPHPQTAMTLPQQHPGGGASGSSGRPPPLPSQPPAPAAQAGAQPQSQPQQQQPRKSGASGSLRRSQEWPDIPEIGKIEEKNPEILAQKILEKGRQIEAVKYGTELTPRVQQGASGGAQQAERNNRKVPPLRLPKMTAASKPSAAATPPTSKTPVPPQDTTPRVNDFEDRLKNLITSVLNDNSSPASSSSPIPPPISESLKQQFAVPEREGLFARAPVKSTLAQAQHQVIQHVQSQPDYTQFSPAKLALRRHLSQERLYAPHSKTSGGESYIRTIGDLVTGEIERSLEMSSASGSHPARTYSPISRPGSTDTHREVQSPAVQAPERAECVEGLAASLRDSLRTPAEEIPSDQEQHQQPQQAVPPAEASFSEETSPSKRKRSSTDSSEPAKKNAKWQDKISVRFDRMMAFASTEMDKRRRSTESCSPRTEPFSSPRGKDGMSLTVASASSSSKEPTPVREPQEQPEKKESPIPSVPSSAPSSASEEPVPRKEKHRESSSKSSDKKRDKERDKDRDKSSR